ncbi:hypothetical protein MHK_007931 [Candidatus Magnetomorum sp. HK-1]|nr:hypothetical protein MHK_007931 [Candidatus Magnetomorum sp. HK-1]
MNGDIIEIKIANLSHIEGIFDLYQSVHINEKNLHRKIDQHHPDNFSQTGGIFKKLDFNTLKSMIFSQKYHVLVAESKLTKKVVGYISFHLESIRRYKISEIQNCPDISSSGYQHFIGKLIKGKAAYAVDMIIANDWRRKNICLFLQKFEYYILREQGYSYVFYEVYSVLEKGIEISNPNMLLAEKAFNSKIISYYYKNLQVGSKIIQVRSDYHVVNIEKIDQGLAQP